MHFSHRLIVGVLVSAALTPALSAQGPLTQSTTRKRMKGPRALAVVRWQADEKGSGHPVLLPVAVLDDGKVFDASVYKTSPQPMAIQSGTVYEAAQHGQPLGFFTVVSTTRSKNDDHAWIGLGKWKTDLPAFAEKKDVHQANVIIGTPQASAAGTQGDESEPKRKATQVYDESGRPIDNSAGDEPPTLSKSGKREPVERSPRVASPEHKPAPESAPQSPDDDPDRPRLKKGPASSATSVAPNPVVASSSTTDDDPNRPVLRRGKPGAEVRTEPATTEAPIPKEVISRSSVNHPRTYELVAVSDADVSIIPQNYEFKAAINERQAFLRKMEDLVDLELKPRSASSPKVTLRRPKPADPARFADVRFEILDLDYNNSPEIVLTGTYVLSATQRIPFALVARGDYEGNPRQLLFEKNERFEFIDAVDLDGDGPAEMLFRRIGAGGSDFVLYRSSPDGLSEVFRGGTAE